MRLARGILDPNSPLMLRWVWDDVLTPWQGRAQPSLLSPCIKHSSTEWGPSSPRLARVAMLVPPPPHKKNFFFLIKKKVSTQKRQKGAQHLSSTLSQLRFLKVRVILQGAWDPFQVLLGNNGSFARQLDFLRNYKQQSSARHKARDSQTKGYNK